MKAVRVLGLVSVIAVVLLPTIAAVAEGERHINTDFNAPAKDILQLLKRVGNLADFALPEGYGDKKVSVTVVDKTPAEAFTQVLDAIGLVAINDGGTLVIKPIAGDRAPRLAEPVRSPESAPFVREAPRPDADEVSRPVASTTTTAPKKEKVYRLIIPTYMNLMITSDIFGGSTIDENNYLGGNSANGGRGTNGNSGGQGGYGSSATGGAGNRGNSGSRGGYGSSGIGSNRGH